MGDTILDYSHQNRSRGWRRDGAICGAQNYAKGTSLVVYMGEDIGPADELPKVNTLEGQSQHT